MSFSAITALDPSSKHRKIKAFLRFSAGASALLSRKNPIIQSFPNSYNRHDSVIFQRVAYTGTLRVKKSLWQRLCLRYGTGVEQFINLRLGKPRITEHFNGIFPGESGPVAHGNL